MYIEHYTDLGARTGIIAPTADIVLDRLQVARNDAERFAALAEQLECVYVTVLQNAKSIDAWSKEQGILVVVDSYGNFHRYLIVVD